jgi:hypothetical protein
MAGNKIKLEDISAILVADTNLQSGAEANDVEEYFKEEEEEEEEQQQQQQQASAEVAITNTDQRNHQPNCAAICVLMAKEREQCTSVPNVMWACVWCLVTRNITPE